MTSVPDALDSALVALRASGVDTPRLDAELLLAHALGVRREELITRDLDVSGPAAREFRALVRRRAVDREPIAYLLGRKGFRRIELAVDGRVLVPRPETELLVELAVAALAPGAHVVDVGTGSGAIALALADERPDLDVTGADLSPDALAVARANDTAGRVTWVEGEGLPDGGWDAVVANLPYIEHGETVRPELRHEPRLALFGGDDGLDVIRAVAAQARDVAWVAFEHGATHGEAVRALLGPGSVTHRDFAGHERVTVRC